MTTLLQEWIEARKQYLNANYHARVFILFVKSNDTYSTHDTDVTLLEDFLEKNGHRSREMYSGAEMVELLDLLKEAPFQVRIWQRGSAFTTIWDGKPGWNDKECHVCGKGFVRTSAAHVCCPDGHGKLRSRAEWQDNPHVRENKYERENTKLWDRWESKLVRWDRWRIKAKKRTVKRRIVRTPLMGMFTTKPTTQASDRPALAVSGT